MAEVRIPELFAIISMFVYASLFQVKERMRGNKQKGSGDEVELGLISPLYPLAPGPTTSRASRNRVEAKANTIIE